MMIIKKRFLVNVVFGSVLCMFFCSCSQLPCEMILWSQADSQGQTLNNRALKHAIARNCINHIPDATLTYFPPKNVNGTAVVICPGGGYGGVCYGREGVVVAQWLNKLGVTVFVLKYRLPREGFVHPSPLLDAQRAIRYVRSNADKYGDGPTDGAYESFRG